MDSRDLVLATLGSNFVQVHEYTLRGLQGDATTAIVLSKLIAFYEYNAKTGRLNNGWFPFNAVYIEQTLGINEYHQRKSLDVLCSKGLIEVDFQGFPKRRFININFYNLQLLLEGNSLNGKPKTKSTPDKTAFYAELNTAMATPVSDAVKCMGNIPADLFMFMYAWSKTYTILVGEGEWNWTPKQYGILKNYWKPCYTDKRYDYSKLWDFIAIMRSEHKLTKEDFTLQKWIDVNRSLADKSHVHQKTVQQFLNAEGAY
jgi:hypothetical protein